MRLPLASSVCTPYFAPCLLIRYLAGSPRRKPHLRLRPCLALQCASLLLPWVPNSFVVPVLSGFATLSTTAHKTRERRERAPEFESASSQIVTDSADSSCFILISCLSHRRNSFPIFREDRFGFRDQLSHKFGCVGSSRVSTAGP
jgi:hypothetical protein